MLVVGEMVDLFVRHFTTHSHSLSTCMANRAALWMSLLLIALQLLLTCAQPLQQMFQSNRWMPSPVITALGLAKFFAVETEMWLLRRFGIRQM